MNFDDIFEGKTKLDSINYILGNEKIALEIDDNGDSLVHYFIKKKNYSVASLAMVFSSDDILFDFRDNWGNSVSSLLLKETKTDLGFSQAMKYYKEREKAYNRKIDNRIDIVMGTFIGVSLFAFIILILNSCCCQSQGVPVLPDMPKDVYIEEPVEPTPILPTKVLNEKSR